MRPPPPEDGGPSSDTARRERLKDAAAFVAPIWAFLAAIATPLLAGGDVGRFVFAVAVLVLVVVSMTLAGVSVSSPFGRAAHVVSRLGRAPRRVFSAAWRPLRQGWGTLSAALAGAVAGMLAVLLVMAVAGTVPNVAALVTRAPCDQPLELRLLTSAENVAAFRAAGRAFALANADFRDCPPVRFTVDREPPPETMATGVGERWSSLVTGSYRALVGIHPDIVVTSSRATEDYLRKAFANFGSQAGFRPLGSVATSALVVAFTPALERRVGRPGPPANLADIMNSVKGSPLVRPRADLSEPGLLASAALYAAAPGTDVATELGLSPPGLPLSDGASLLCHAEDGLDAGSEQLAMVVPEHLVLSINAKGGLGPCPEGTRGEQLTMHAADDLPTLDYRFAALTWRDQRSAVRDEWVGRFHSWLLENGLADHGYRDPRGRLTEGGSRLGDVIRLRPPREDAATLIARVGGAHPGMSFLLLADVSGSMDNPISGGSALRVAADGAQALVRRLRDGTDTVRLATFAAPGPATAAPGAGTSAVSAGLGALTVRGRDAPLGDALTQATAWMRDESKPVVVLLTDGGSRAGNARETARRIRAIPGLKVLLMLTGEQTCEAVQVAELVRAIGSRIRCTRIAPGAAAGPYDEESRTVDTELEELWRGDS